MLSPNVGKEQRNQSWYGRKEGPEGSTHTAPETASDPGLLYEGQYNSSSFTLSNFWLVWRESRNGFTGPKITLQMSLFTLNVQDLSSRVITHMVRCGSMSWPFPTLPFLPPSETVGWHMASALSDLASTSFHHFNIKLVSLLMTRSTNTEFVSVA